jgi:hypothetical protein
VIDPFSTPRPDGDGVIKTKPKPPDKRCTDPWDCPF